jgi:large subunit ribosomal protein L20
MVRVKRGPVSKNRRLRILTFSKGFKGAHARLFRIANEQVMKSLVYSYSGRRRRKREFRKLWICRINAASRNEGLTYSEIRRFLGVSEIRLNLKMLSQLAVLDKNAFEQLVWVLSQRAGA